MVMLDDLAGPAFFIGAVLPMLNLYLDSGIVSCYLLATFSAPWFWLSFGPPCVMLKVRNPVCREPTPYSYPLQNIPSSNISRKVSELARTPPFLT